MVAMLGAGLGFAASSGEAADSTGGEPAAALPPRTTQFSAEVSQAIRRGLPNFEAKKSLEPEDPAAKPEDSTVVLLPKVIVKGERQPNLSEEDVATKAGLSALLAKKYPGASVRGQDPKRIDGATPNYAVLMHSDDKRLGAMKTLGELADDLARIGNVSGSKKLKGEINRTFLRRTDPIIEAMDQAVNRGTR